MVEKSSYEDAYNKFKLNLIKDELYGRNLFDIDAVDRDIG